MEKVKIGIVGPGNIGLDLLHKVLRSDYLQPELVVNIFHSNGIDYANNLGMKTSIEGIQAILDNKEIQIVFDCTSASAHEKHAPMIKAAGKIAIDLTPAAVGPYLIPAVNLNEDTLNKDNVNMVTCAGQATVPIVNAINEVADVEYAEIVASISSKSAGPGTRANIDEFTITTKKALMKVGGADDAKVILILNPAEPPIFMRNTIHTKVKNGDIKAITEAVDKMVEKIKTYVPGYKVLLSPIIKDNIVTTMIQVEGLGDYLPVYSGNLDIINAAAINTAEAFAKKMLGGGANV
jgi:acetaldehyde dehydrogenase